jgi:anti-anti-sigma regulatory factor
MKNRTFNIKALNSKDPRIQTVIFEGDLGIKNAGIIHETIQSLKISAESVTLSLKSVEKIDITTIQNIRALRNELTSQGKKVEVTTNLTPEIERLLRNTGFDKTI